jgi:hypothetical protein
MTWIAFAIEARLVMPPAHPAVEGYRIAPPRKIGFDDDVGDADERRAARTEKTPATAGVGERG